MQSVSIFAGNRIRMHANNFTDDGLGIAGEPFIILSLDVSDEELDQAIRQCLAASKTGIPFRPWSKEETAAYYRHLGVKSQRALGAGAELRRENGRLTVTPANERGLFG